jgi:hypothetical protein
MTERLVIPLLDNRRLPVRIPLRAAPHDPVGALHDLRGRRLRDLRISVTDRCNFRCRCCMPKEVFDGRYPYLPHARLLGFEEIARLARLFARHVVGKIRLRGGLAAATQECGGIDRATLDELRHLPLCSALMPRVLMAINHESLARREVRLPMTQTNPSQHDFVWCDLRGSASCGPMPMGTSRNDGIRT